MLLSAVSVLVVAQSSSEIPEGLMNNPVQCFQNSGNFCCVGIGDFKITVYISLEKGDILKLYLLSSMTTITDILKACKHTFTVFQSPVKNMIKIPFRHLIRSESCWRRVGAAVL